MIESTKKMKKLSSTCMALLLLSVASFSQAEENKAQNGSLMDARVPSQYIPMAKTHSGDVETFSFIDRTSVKLHPYNQNIRTFTGVINNHPALDIMDGETKVSYQSIVTHYYANCDKKELVKSVVTSHSGYFGEGEQQSYNEEPRRWQPVNQGSSQRNLLVVACTLPLSTTK